MGQIRVPITIEGKGHRAQVTALVDTGASLTVIPRSLARQLKLAKFRTVSAGLADGRARRMPVVQAMVRLDDRLVPCSVLVAPAGEVLLGSETLELLDVTVDPRRRKLKLGTHFALKAV